MQQLEHDYAHVDAEDTGPSTPPYFHHRLNREQAEDLVKAKAEEGTFLLRDKEDVECVITVFGSGRCHHFMVTRNESTGLLMISSQELAKPCRTLSELVLFIRNGDTSVVPFRFTTAAVRKGPVNPTTNLYMEPKRVQPGAAALQSDLALQWQPSGREAPAGSHLGSRIHKPNQGGCHSESHGRILQAYP